MYDTNKEREIKKYVNFKLFNMNFSIKLSFCFFMFPVNFYI